MGSITPGYFKESSTPAGYDTWQICDVNVCLWDVRLHNVHRSDLSASVKHPNTRDETVMIEQSCDCVQRWRASQYVFRNMQGDTSTSQFFVVCVNRTNRPATELWTLDTLSGSDTRSYGSIFSLKESAQVTCDTLVWGALWLQVESSGVWFCSSSSHLSQVRLIAKSRNRSRWAQM